MAATLVFDIETIPDIAGLRNLHDLGNELADAEVAEFAFQKRRASHGTDFLPLHLHRVVAISCVLAEAGQLRVFSMAEPQMNEGAIIQRFFDGIDKYTPTLVSWNGGGFDLQVLHYRGLKHCVAAPRYWETGEGDYADSREFKWNNYLSRYHSRHTDLMDVLALYQPRANAPLDELAKICGFPGKLGMDGSKVWDTFQQGRLQEIRDYCETDVMNTYLVYLRYQLMRGVLSREEHQATEQGVRDWLAQQSAAHWIEYRDAWPTL